MFDSGLGTGMMIGKGSLHHGLFLLDTPLSSSVPTTLSVCSTMSLKTKCDVWHCRLGHPAPVKLCLLHNEWSLPKFSSLTSHCTVCHKAKQRRLPFPSNNNRTSNPFDLVHIDTWSPFQVPAIEG